MDAGCNTCLFEAIEILLIGPDSIPYSDVTHQQSGISALLRGWHLPLLRMRENPPQLLSSAQAEPRLPDCAGTGVSCPANPQHSAVTSQRRFELVVWWFRETTANRSDGLVRVVSVTDPI